MVFFRVKYLVMYRLKEVTIIMKSRLKHAFDIQGVRRISLCLFIAAFSIWEPCNVFYLQEAFRGLYQPGSWQFYMLYHFGDVNNSIFVAVHLFAVLAFFISSNTVVVIISSVLSTGLFVYIEWHDPMDIPAAILGAILFFVYMQPVSMNDHC